MIPSNFKAKDSEPYLIDINKYKLPENSIISENACNIYYLLDENDKKYVAKTIKNLESFDERQQFSREIKIYLQIPHSIVVSMPGFSFTDIHKQNKITFIMKCMEKGSLSELFQNTTNFPLNSTQRQIILIGTAFGMMLLHSRHIINRDIKPENILLYDDYKPCLTDFNLSKSFDPLNSIDQSVSGIGTPGYIAPEVISNTNYGPPADVFSFGVLMLELLKGKRILCEKTFQDVKEVFFYLKKVENGLKPEIDKKLREIYPDLTNLIDQCLEIDPIKRPTFVTIFKKLSTFPKEFFRKYEDLFPFMKENDTDKLYGQVKYGLKDADFNQIELYVQQLLNELKPEKIINDEEFNKIKKTCKLIFALPKSKINIPEELSKETKDLLYNLWLFFPNDHECSSISIDLNYCNFNQFSDFFCFPIVSSNIEKILANLNLFEFEAGFNICMFFTFYTWISFGIRILKEQQISDVIPLLKILSHIIRISANNQSKYAHREVAVLCFVNMIALAAERNLIEDHDKIMEEVSVFYNQIEIKTLATPLDNMIAALSCKLFNENEQLSNSAINLIKIITKVLSQNPKYFMKEVIQPMIGSLKKYIINIDMDCLPLFAKAVNNVEIDDSSVILKQLINNILSKHFNSKNIQEDKINSSTNTRKKSSNSDNFHPPADLHQIDKVSIPDISTSFQYRELSSFFDKEAIPSIPYVEEIVTSDENLAKYFVLEALSKLRSFDIKKSKLLYFDQFAFIMHLITHAVKKYPSIQILDKRECSMFINKDIFDPNVTNFNKNENYEIIVSLRHYIIQFLLAKQPSILNKVLEECSVYPELFRECICHLELITKNKISLNLWRVSDSLFSSLSDYRVNSDTLNMTEDDKLYLMIRKRIYNSLKSFRLNDIGDELKTLFNSQVFVKNFFILLMEPPIRSYISNFLLYYLKSVELDKTQFNCLDYLFDRIIDLFKVCCHEMPESEGISLLSDLLTKFNMAMESNKLLVEKFKSIASTLCHIIIEIDISFVKVENLDDLLIPLIEFLFQIYQNKTIDAVDASLLETLITHFLPKLTKSRIIAKIFQIISNKKMSIISPTFEIKQKEVICPFIHAFYKTNQLYNILNFISILCSNSTENCFRCHECKLDLYIIDIIIDWANRIHELIPKKNITKNIELENENAKNYFVENDICVKETEEGFIINEELVDSLLDIFSQIASSVSSVPAFQRFFDALFPKDSAKISLIHQHILKSFESIIDRSTKIPSDPFPMPSKEIVISNIPRTSIEKGFCFSFWISMSSENELQQNLLELTDGKNKFIINIKNFMMHNYALHLYMKSNNMFVNFDFAITVPPKQWTMITINTSFDFSEKLSYISIYADQKLIEEESMGLIFEPDQYLKCVINSKDNLNNSQNTDPYLIGLFMMSESLLKDEIQYIAAQGQRITHFPYSNKIIFAYKPQYIDRITSFTPIHRISCINDELPTLRSLKKIYSFVDLLPRQYNISRIVPIFNIFDDKVKAVLPTIILSKLFKLGDEFQKSFFMSKSFVSIANLLKNTEDSNITFELYQFYYNVLDSITYENLKEQLIDTILMNFELWCKTSENDKQKIFNHWDKNLYLTYNYIINKIKQPEWFIFNSQKCYDRNNLNNQTYSKCRKSFYSIIFKIFENQITVDYILLIISILLKHKSLTEKKDIFENLLFSLILNNEIIKQVKSNFSLIVNNLYQIFNDTRIDYEMIYNIIFLFVKIYKSGRISLQIPFHSIIQSIQTNLFIDRSLLLPFQIFSSLIDLMTNDKAVELLPLLCINALKGDINYAKELITKINKYLDYYINETTPFYLSLLLFKYNEMRKDLIALNADIFEEHIIEFINAVKVIGLTRYNNTIFENVIHDILNHILSNHKYKIHQEIDLFYLITDFIFYRSASSQSPLTELYSRYQNNEDINLDENTSSTDLLGTDEENVIEIIKNLIPIVSNGFAKDKYKFGLRFSGVKFSVSVWKDVNLSKNLYSLFEDIFCNVNVKKSNNDSIEITQKIRIISSFLLKNAGEKNREEYEKISAFIRQKANKISPKCEVNIEGYDQKSIKAFENYNDNLSIVKMYSQDKESIVRNFLVLFNSYNQFNQILNNTEVLKSIYNDYKQRKIESASNSCISLLTNRIEEEENAIKNEKRKSSSPKMPIPLVKQPEMFHLVINFNNVSQIASAKTTLLQDKSALLFQIIDFEGKMKIFTINTSQLVSQHLDLRETKSRNIVSSKSERGKLINSPMFIDDSRVCYIDNDESCVNIVKLSQNLKTEKIYNENDDICFIETSPEGWIAISTNDTAVTLYNLDLLPSLRHSLLDSIASTFSNLSSSKNSATSTNERISMSSSELFSQSDILDSAVYSGTIFLFTSLVTCISISEKFGVFVCGTDDNRLLICELNLSKMKVRKTIKTKGKPKKIVITDNLGLVAVLTTKIKNGFLFKKLILYNLDGEKIRSEKIDVVEMIKASSCSGDADFLIVSDGENNIFATNAIHLNVGEPIATCGSKIIQLEYIREESLIVAFLDDGIAFIIHHYM